MQNPRVPNAGSGSIPQRAAAAHVEDVITDADLDEELILEPAVARAPLAPIDKPPAASHALDDDDDFDDEPLASPAHQFTLRDMMIFTLLAAIGFGLMRVFPPSHFAGAMGGIAILGLALLSVAQPEKLFYHLLWWTVLGVYVISSVFAVIAN